MNEDIFKKKLLLLLKYNLKSVNKIFHLKVWVDVKVFEIKYFYLSVCKFNLNYDFYSTVPVQILVYHFK